jgi:ATP-binding cassette subfamily B protein
VLNNARAHVVSGLIENLSGDLKYRTFNHLHSLSLRFHLERPTGSLAHSFGTIQPALETLLWGLLLYLIPTMLELTIALYIITIFYGLSYALIMLITFGIYVSLGIYHAQLTKQLQADYAEKRSQTTSDLIDSLSHAELVKYFSGQTFESNKAHTRILDQIHASHRYSQKTMYIQSIQSLIIGIGLTLLLLITAKKALAGTFHLSDFVLVQSYVMQFLVPLSYLGYFFFQSKKAYVDIANILDLFDITPEIYDSPQSISLAPTSMHIRFSHVSFGYTDEYMVINDCTFTASSGQKIAFVGPTGAGKTTLVRLLFRLYDVTRGSIMINSNDIKDITQKSLHSLIGYVPQEISLFNQTLYYNITYGQPSKTKAEVLEAIHLAGLDSFIQALPLGLETMVGNHGLKISGGEKQRIALARVILKKPALYILDEATSALDGKTEQTILTNMRSFAKDATCFIIAHRLSSIMDADEIIVLEKGTIVQRGTHQRLLHDSGLYAQLWRTQHQPKNDIQTSETNIFHHP